MKKNNIYRSTFSIILPVGLLFVFFLVYQWQAINEPLDDKWDAAIKNQNGVDDKQKGAHVFGKFDSTDFQPLIQNNLEWVTLVSWGSQEDIDSPIVTHHYGDSLHMLQHDSSWIHRIELVRAAGFKVFVKPHVWINSPADGKWRSDIFPTSEENWALWKESYRNFIFRYAKIAEQANAEMFCIGIEFSRLSVEKPDFWKKLIREVRSIYAGKITYAANWYNEFEKITFWDQLNFIGIQAYFPLVKNKYPSVEQISKGWDKHLPALESMHEKFNRKILFTEMGYKSTANSGIKPWEWIEDPANQDKTLSTETQANCYKAFFKTIWKKKWFAGVHIWQLRTDFVADSGKRNLDFTPQGKPAQDIITKGFE